MSDIDFIKNLGDNLEDAITRESAERRRFLGGPRKTVIAAVLLLAVATGFATAQIMKNPETLAANSIGCYTSADLDGDVTIVSADGRPPTEVCAGVRKEIGEAPATLVACVQGEIVAVFPGNSCEESGLESLPIGFDLARQKVERLDRAIARLESKSDCIDPERLAEMAQDTLDRLGWNGWTASLDGEGSEPCGWIRSPGGGYDFQLSGALNTQTGQLMVTDGPPRSLFKQLYGPGGVSTRLMDRSGERCFTPAEIRTLSSEELASIGQPLRFSEEALDGYELTDARGERYAEGCAVIGDVSLAFPEPGKTEIKITILQSEAATASDP